MEQIEKETLHQLIDCLAAYDVQLVYDLLSRLLESKKTINEKTLEAIHEAETVFENQYKYKLGMDRILLLTVNSK